MQNAANYFDGFIVCQIIIIYQFIIHYNVEKLPGSQLYLLIWIFA